jgi:hypothetical protein
LFREITCASSYNKKSIIYSVGIGPEVESVLPARPSYVGSGRIFGLRRRTVLSPMFSGLLIGNIIFDTTGGRQFMK